jgi:dissimilatory sulfite reductase (desulfoviridin) alpha/beta subunit
MVIVPEVIQRDGSYALVVEFASGIISPAVFETIKDILREEGARVHLTTSQKMMILDLTESAAQRARVRLDGIGAAFKLPKRFYQPRVCVGSRHCKLRLQDTLGFASQVSQQYSCMDI